MTKGTFHMQTRYRAQTSVPCQVWRITTHLHQYQVSAMPWPHAPRITAAHQHQRIFHRVRLQPNAHSLPCMPLPANSCDWQHAPSAPFPMGSPGLVMLQFTIENTEASTCKSTAARKPICGASQSDGPKEELPGNLINSTPPPPARLSF